MNTGTRQGLGAPFGRFWLASGASNLADGVFSVALPLLALTLTRSPLLVAGVSVMMTLPWLLFSLVAGAIADRVDRRRLLLAVSVGRTAAIGAAALLVASGDLRLWMLYVLALGLGIAETLYDTSAQSVLPMVVRPDQLSRANGRLYGVEVAGQTFLGPPLGGLLAGIAIAVALGASAVGFALAALVLVTLRGGFRPARTGPVTSVRADIAEGVRYLWRHALLRRLALLVGGSNLLFAAVAAVIPLHAVSPGPMGLSEAGFGVFLAASGVGAVLGSLIAPRLEVWWGRARSLRVATVATALLFAAPLLVQPVAVAVFWLVGAAMIVLWNVITVSLRQRLVPGELLGRVNAGYRLVAWGMAPIGAAVGGVVGEVIAVEAVFAGAGIGGLALLVAMRPLTDAALADPEPADPDPADPDPADPDPADPEPAGPDSAVDVSKG